MRNGPNRPEGKHVPNQLCIGFAEGAKWRPKGCEWVHAKFVRNVRNVHSILGLAIPFSAHQMEGIGLNYFLSSCAQTNS
jgi:hypothetical protein